jgi:hypothetical protein
MSGVSIFIVLATALLGFVASIWSGERWVNLFIKLIFIGATVFGAICSAAVLGIHP